MLQVVHDKIDDVPEQYRELYTERDGKFHLTGISGVKTQADVDRVHSDLTKERDEHKKTKEHLVIWEGMDHDEVVGKLDRIHELEVAAKGNKEEMDSKLEELTEARIKSRIAPVERENINLKKKLEDAEGELETLRSEKIQRLVHDKVRAAAAEGKVIPEAIDDVLLLANAVFEVTSDGVVLTRENPYGMTAGLAPDLWLQEMQEKRPHWWPRSTGGESKGSGSSGGFSNNPWTNEHWNLTEQGKVVKQHGQERAEQMAKAAGTTFGGPRPMVTKK